MRLIQIIIAVMLFLASSVTWPGPVSAANCEFVLGFAALDALIPSIVGNCLDNEHFNTVNGDSLQATTGPTGGTATGLLVWRKADNWTAYTDGYHTWINGPYGLQERLNTERFSWEAAVIPSPTPTPVAPPTVNASANGMQLMNIRAGWGYDNYGNYLPALAFRATNTSGSAMTWMDDRQYFSAAFTDPQHGVTGFPSLCYALQGVVLTIQPGGSVDIRCWGASGYLRSLPASSLPTWSVALSQGNYIAGSHQLIGTFAVAGLL